MWRVKLPKSLVAFGLIGGFGCLKMLFLARDVYNTEGVAVASFIYMLTMMLAVTVCWVMLCLRRAVTSGMIAAVVAEGIIVRGLASGHLNPHTIAWDLIDSAVIKKTWGERKPAVVLHLTGNAEDQVLVSGVFADHQDAKCFVQLVHARVNEVRK